jgi:hypothetical protein
MVHAPPPCIWPRIDWPARQGGPTLGQGHVDQNPFVWGKPQSQKFGDRQNFTKITKMGKNTSKYTKIV